MRTVKLLPAMIVVAVVLGMSRPAGTGSDRSGTEAAATREPLAASARLTDTGAAAEAPEAATGGRKWLRCRPELLNGIPEQMPGISAIADTLAVSRDAEHLLTAAVLTLDTDPARGSELLARAWNANPGHPLIALDRLDACTGQPGLPICAAHDVEAEAIRSDGSNGAVWARIAGRSYGRADEAGTLQALHRAATAPRYDVYWIDHVQLFERALAASTGLSYAERTVAAIGVAAAMWRPDLKMVTVCSEQVGASPEWRPACGDFGKRLEADGGTLLDVAVGVTMQLAVYEAIGDKQQIAIASRKRQELNDIMIRPAGAEVFLLGDERLLSDYLSEFDAYGELAAMQLLESEVARLKAVPGYGPCD